MSMSFFESCFDFILTSSPPLMEKLLLNVVLNPLFFVDKFVGLLQSKQMIMGLDLGIPPKKK